MPTAEYRVQKHILCYNYNSIRDWSYYQFHWYASPTSKLSRAYIWHFYSVNHLFFIWCYAHRDTPFVFNIWWPLCGGLFVQHGCWLFSKFKFTLVSGVLLSLVQESSVSIITRFLRVGKTFTKKISRIYMYRNTVPKWLISHHGREKQHKWKPTMLNEQDTQWLHHFRKQN